MAEPKTLKFLLLGANEAGKTTLAKQMKILHLGAYTDEERLDYRPTIYSNILQFSLTVIQNMGALEIKFASPSGEADSKKLVTMAGSTEEGTMSADLAALIKSVWADAGIKACFERANMYDINDPTSYFMDDLERVCEPNYLPTEKDVLYSRLETTGTSEEQFNYKDLLIRLFDVGGKREERKGWIKNFEDVSCIIFVSALSAYDLVLVEDDEMNRVHESLHLFNSICNHKFFATTTMVLFLNKTDIFKNKIKTSPLTICFPNYTGGDSYEQGTDFIKKQFEELNLKKGEKEIYTHLTCAVDTQNVDSAFNTVVDTVVKNLKACGLY
ncbi:hypothetical protein AALO_G00137870 [Alosa alosa]|uniref:Uncharacterized protein n=1 Tax=Alosa alosa TaxID=278164 RepID=A0AAV6GLJ9_9TELE|nr:guanine nucleotide-binding protein G(t) subunit alpha-3-like [Alosa alosa]KAG5274580.1 hypothetical protein AALO_G00137870 [Alosa alosa]